MTDGFTRSIICEFHVDCKRFFGFSPFFRFAQKGRAAPASDSQKVYLLRIVKEGVEENETKVLKKMGSFLLASAMVLTMFPTFSATVHAEENKLPTKEQFATAEQLKSFNTNLDDEDGKDDKAKIYFGSNNQEWWIVGSQQEQALTLIAATPLTEPQQFEVNYSQNKTDSSLWAACTKKHPENGL